MVHFFLRSKSFMTDDGARFKDGENELKLDEAFKTYFEKNGSRLNATNNGNGSGSEGGGGSGKVPDSDNMTASQKMEAGRK